MARLGAERGERTLDLGDHVSAGSSVAGDEPNDVYTVVAVTARDGSYSAQVAPGMIFIGADGPFGIATPTPEPGYVVERPGASIDLELGGPSSRQGAVHDQNGFTAATVHLLLFGSATGPIPIEEAHSDAHGFFHFAARPGRYWLVVGHGTWKLADGCEQMEIVVPEGGALDLDLTVARASEGEAGAKAEK